MNTETAPQQAGNGAGRPAGPLAFARMTGSSIAGRDAAPWVTDFLNAAYYRRPRRPRRRRPAARLLRPHHVLVPQGARPPAAHHRPRAPSTAPSAADRFDTRGSRPRHPRPRAAARRRRRAARRLVPGGVRRRRAARLGHRLRDARGERDAYDPACRLALARLGALTPESRAAATSRSGTRTRRSRCPPPRASSRALTQPETWPDYASEIGRFTPLRAGGLLGQTFEIEVAAGTDAGRPSSRAAT